MTVVSPETLTVIIGALATLAGAAAGFIVKSRLSDVIASGSVREETAVGKMAALLERNAARDEQVLQHLLSMLDKALDTVARQTGALQQVALALQGHEQDESLRWSQDRETSAQILKAVEDARAAVAGMERLVADLALQLLAERRRREEGSGDT